MNIRRHDISISSTTGAAATATTSSVNGRVLSIHITYAAAASDGGLATTAVIGITSAVTNQTLFSETLTTLATTTVYLHRRPRVQQQTTAGVVLTATESLVREPAFVANEALLVTATDVGAGTRTATIRIITDG